jgi:hypothetical protein
MSAIEAQDGVLSEDTAARDEGDNLKLVPVAESIRYRKRAQTAEKKVEALTRELQQAQSQANEAVEQLHAARLEQELARKLIVAGTVDVEASVLMAKARLEAEPESDVDSVIEQLKKEKPHLFAVQDGYASAAKKTSPAKDRMQNSQTVLERAAKKAAETGSRRDLEEYLRLRRNFL